MTDSRQVTQETVDGLAGVWPGPLPLEELARWLSLDEERRRATIDRVRAIAAFNELEKPTVADATRIAESAGLKRSRFYILLKAWRSSQSLESIVPHARSRRKDPAKPISRTQDDAIDEIVWRKIEELLRLDPAAKAFQAHQLIEAECTARGLAAPSYPTVLRRFEHFARSLPGGARLEGFARKRGDAFGGVIYVDHCGVDIWLDDGTDLPSRAMIVTLVLDRYSRLIIGASIGTHAGFSNLEDASERARSWCADRRWVALPLSLHRPILSVVKGSSKYDWEGISRSIPDFDLQFIETGPYRYGKFIRTLVGSTVGNIRLLRSLSEPGRASPVRRAPEKRITVRTLDEAQLVLQPMVEAHNVERGRILEVLAQRASTASRVDALAKDFEDLFSGLVRAARTGADR